jgi:hypothetical protein
MAMRGPVSYDAGKTTEHLQDMQDLVSGVNPSILVFGKDQLDKEMQRAFRQKTDPEGTSWPRREQSYPWDLMNKTGTLKASVRAGFGIKTKSGRPKLFAKVVDAFYLGTYTRGAGHKPLILVAGAVHFGRKRARRAAGWYSRTRKGTTTYRYTAGGSKLRRAASSGVVPPRKIFGMGQVAKFRLKRFAQRELKKAHD